MQPAETVPFLLLLSLFACCLLQAQDRPQVVVPYGEGNNITISADQIETQAGEVISGEGNVVANFEDTTLRARRVSYTQDSGLLLIEDDIELIRGPQWLKAQRAELALDADTGVLFDVEGFTDEELYIRAEKLIRTGPDTYIVENGFLTACEERVPKWSFTIDRATIKTGSTARLSNTLFRLKKVPVLYLPYLIFPTATKERSSGFMLPTTGSSNNKGRRISESFYLVLGRSADLMIHEDYFSERGFGHGFTFRTRPNTVSSLELDGYLIDDRKDQGGASVNGVGETYFGNGFRAVADFNLVTNFVFRQVFSDNFFTATRPTENSRFFLTNNFKSRSFNILLSREETIFPERNVITRSLPELQFRLNGQRILESPFYLNLNASAGAMNRSDLFIKTPAVSQRLDFFPQLYFSLPLFQGLRLSPQIGVRETFYSDSLQEGSAGNSEITGQSLDRQYLDFSLTLSGWGLSRISTRGDWKHLIEPMVRYQYIHGIDDFDQIIRFDERDAIADTNEVEYSLMNRVFVKREGGRVHEWLSLKLGQKHYFDSDFGGAIEPGRINQFFPLNTLTGHPFAISNRDFSPLTTLLRFTPEPRYSFDVRGDFDTRTRQLKNFSLTGFLNRRLFSFSGTYFLTDELLEGLPGSNQIQGRATLGDLNRGISLASSFSYDAQETRFLNYLGRVNYFWDCCGISLEVFGFNVGVRQEQQIRFSFFLKGIGSFGNIRRPDTNF